MPFAERSAVTVERIRTSITSPLSSVKSPPPEAPSTNPQGIITRTAETSRDRVDSTVCSHSHQHGRSSTYVVRVWVFLAGYVTRLKFHLTGAVMTGDPALTTAYGRGGTNHEKTLFGWWRGDRGGLGDWLGDARQRI